MRTKNNRSADAEIRQRSVNLILDNWGTLRDLPAAVVPVVWVTVYRAIEAGMRAEQSGGPAGMVKETLRGGRLGREVQEATLKIQFLQRYLPLLRTGGDSQLLIDILKWNITDAADMSRLARAFARMFAKADPLYNQAVPVEIR
jgi:hypothetical protein